MDQDEKSDVHIDMRFNRKYNAAHEILMRVHSGE